MPTMEVPQKKNGDSSSATDSTCAMPDSTGGGSSVCGCARSVCSMPLAACSTLLEAASGSAAPLPLAGTSLAAWPSS